MISLTNKIGYQNVFLASIKNKFMQTQSILRISLAVILLAMLASCKSNKQGRYIPKDAAAVIVADGKSLSSKLSWDEVKQNPELQKMLLDSETPANIKSILNNPDSSGIDMQSDIIFFIEKDSIGSYLSVEGTIKDRALFKNFIHQMDSTGTETQVDDISFKSHYPSCLGWDKEKFVFVFDAPSFGNMNASLSQRMMNDSIGASHSRDIGATCKSIFALEASNSLAKNDKFGKLIKETGNIHFWIDSGELYSQMPMFSSGPMAMLNLDDFYKDNITTATLSFENGKISLNSTSYMSERMLAFYKLYVNGKINEDMIQRMPGKDVDGVIAVNFKPDGIKELLKQLNIDGMANGGLKQLGLTTDDIINAFKGDFLFGASDFSIKVDSEENTFSGSTYKYPKQTKQGNFIFAASIGDKDDFNKIFSIANKLIGQSMSDDSAATLPFSMDNNGTYFVISNTKDNTSQYLAGPNSTKFDFINNINGQPFGAYFNLQSFIKAAGSFIDNDSASQAIYDASLKMWNNVYIRGGSIDGDVSTGTLEINLVNNSTNSLKQLSQYISKISGIIKEKKDKMEAEEEKGMKADSAVMVVPPTGGDSN